MFAVPEKGDYEAAKRENDGLRLPARATHIYRSKTVTIPLPSSEDENAAAEVRFPPSFYPIEHGVPIPAKVYRGGFARGQLLIDWPNLKVGDSVYVPDRTSTQVCCAANNRVNFALEQDRQYLVRSVPAGGARVWRIK